MGFLYEDISAIKKVIDSPDIPQFIIDNLSQNIKLRDYQKEAFCDTILYLNSPRLCGNKQTHLLYHMATGSGKTVIMAMAILYYYSLGYRNFLFFTNQTSIVNKTKINFTEKSSSKFLFANQISINGVNVNINISSNFQGVNKNDINICFNTIQGIHNELFFVREDGLTYDDFKDEKVVLLADEAHHLNSLTKNQLKDKEEVDIENTWENTVENIFRANKDNVLLEFTATCNLKDENVTRKYLDKIVFNFTLKEFREAGYTKEFNNYSSDTTPWIRTLQALVLSEYRKLIFEKHRIFSKPVVMLKSYRIADSKSFYDLFYKNLSKLSGSEIDTEIRGNVSSNLLERFLNNAFSFFDSENISTDALAEMIRLDFSKEHAVMMNGESTDNDALYEKVNTLDDKDNPYRLIFTVAKLNEGWDVLNLYDIVRLYETRQGGTNGKVSDFTLSEAQLIGRGARYFPFVFEEGQVSDKKKYTNNLENPEAICETLLYHCMNDSRYITELKLALIQTGFEPDKKIEISYNLKESFMKSSVYRNGIIFTNKQVEKSRDSVTSIDDNLRNKNFTYRCKSGAVSSDKLFDSNGETEFSQMIDLNPIKLKDIDYNILIKAYRSFNETLSFEKIVKKFPNLKSSKEFLTGDSYLGNITITFTTKEHSTPSREDYLNACIKVMSFIAVYVQKIEITYRGTDEFYPKAIKEIIPVRRVRQISQSRVETEAWGEGISQNDSRVPPEFKVNLADKDWYAYDDNKGTSEEKKFVAYMNAALADFKEKYDHIYLIRNELVVSLYSFNSGQKFEPDYILILIKEKEEKNLYLCVFVEPKGEHLLETDKWKGEFLLEMENRAIPTFKFFENDEYKIWGTPLYNESVTKGKFIDYLKDKEII